MDNILSEMKDMVNRLIRAAVCIFVLGLITIGGTMGAFAADNSAQAAAVIEMQSGRVLYNKNADWELPMASTTKIMTAYVAVKYGNLEDVAEAVSYTHLRCSVQYCRRICILSICSMSVLVLSCLFCL